MNAVLKSDITGDSKSLPLRQIERSKNVDALLTQEQSDAIGREAVAAYEEDEQSRAEWKTRTEKAIKLALQMVEAKSTPWPNASNVKFPLVTIAALQFSARAYPALVKVPDLVHYRVMGEDRDGQKASRASRVGRHMSWQLLDQDEAWEEDTDRKFLVVPIVGCAFKKTYWDPVTETNCSRLVLPQNLAVHYYTRSIEACERKTEIFELYEREIRERQLKGLYSQKSFAQAATPAPKLSDQRQGITPPPQSKATPRTLLEQHGYLDLDGDGYPEPYVITVDQSSKKVARIVARFAKVTTEESVQIEALRKQTVALDIQMQQIVDRIREATLQSIDPNDPSTAQVAQNAAEQHIAEQTGPLLTQKATLQRQMADLEQLNQNSPTVLSITPLEHYTKYGFIPSPDGGFYDLGLGSLLGPVNDSVNTLINQLIDSGTLQNGGGGFIGKGARLKGGELLFRPREWKRVEVAGQTLKDSIVPLVIPPPSAVLFQLLSLLITYGEKISSVNEAMQGNNPGQNTPAYNMQAMLEQGLQVFNGIFKRLYRSFRKELRKLYVLNRLYLNPIEYYETLDGRFEALQKDYSGDDKDVVPAADPNAFSNMQNLVKAQFLASRAAVVPGYKNAAVERRLLEAMDIPDPQEVYPLDEKGDPQIPAPRNPELDLKIAEEQRRTLEAKQRSETNAALADAQIGVHESMVLLNQAKAQEINAGVPIDQFTAVTERLRAHSEAMKQMMDAQKEKQNESARTETD